MIRPLVVTLTAFVLVQSFGGARDASAQTIPWNQEVVTARAGELEKAVSGLREVVRGSPNLQNPGTRRITYQILDNLRMIEQASVSLHASLKNGDGMEETLPTYMRLQQIRRDTAVLAQRVDITAVTQPKLDKAKDLLEKIEPYYPAQPEAPAGLK
ncbi:MAG: hypothetical protein ACHQ6T_02485 [Myxococcota bacterium]